MKSAWVLAAACLAVASVSHAENKNAAPKKGLVQQVSGQGYGMAGCGLGSILFGTQPGLIQIVAATFNSTFGNQTFGITSGTSNCVAGSGTSAQLFIEANRESLASDISRGNGETLASLSEILGCDSKAMGTRLQGRYSEIFPSAGVSNEQVSDSILGIVKTDSTIGCQATM